MYSVKSMIHSCSVFLYFILIARFLVIRYPGKNLTPNQYNTVLSDHLSDDNVPCQRIRGATEWCGEYETMWMTCYAFLSHQILIQLKETLDQFVTFLHNQIITASIKALYTASKSFKDKTCYFCNARRKILERKPGLQFLAVVSSLYVEPISLSPIFSLPFIWQTEWYKFSHLSLLL